MVTGWARPAVAAVGPASCLLGSARALPALPDDARRRAPEPAGLGGVSLSPGQGNANPTPLLFKINRPRRC